jgi:hypothetical protein
VKTATGAWVRAGREETNRKREKSVVSFVRVFISFSVNG